MVRQPASTILRQDGQQPSSDPSTRDDNRPTNDNPYAAPVTSSRADAPAVEYDLTEELRSVVGPKKADYYLQRWSTILLGGRGGWNWAAFFLTGFWLVYRKMYKVSLVFWGVIVLLLILEHVLFVEVVGLAEPPAVIGRIESLLISVFFGSFGNGWYLSHAKKVISDVREQQLLSDAHLQALSERGGTSLVSAFGVVVLLFLLLVATVFVLVLLDLTLVPGLIPTD